MPEAPDPSPTPERAPLRLRRANRDQVTPIPAYLDALLPEDHLARLLWQAVEQLDLAAFTADLAGRARRCRSTPRLEGRG